MRLFHVSEEEDIKVFEPRIPYREDMDKSKGLVWAINETCLPSFLTPRNCPRVTYHCEDTTSEEDIHKYFSSKLSKHVIAIEHNWFNTMLDTTLYLYEFDTSKFYLQDSVAGYYVSEVKQVPINRIMVKDIFAELFKRNVEVRLLDNLWSLSDEIKKTTLAWSICRMNNSKKI